MSDEDIGNLHVLAHEGTKESILKLRNKQNNAVTEEMRMMVEFAYDEACFNYFCPENDQERHDYELCHMILHHEELMLDEAIKLDKLKEDLGDLKLELEVYEEMIRRGTVEDKMSEFAPSSDAVMILEQDVNHIQGRVDYHEIWAETARDMIVSPKYRDKDLDVFESIGKKAYNSLSQKHSIDFKISDD